MAVWQKFVFNLLADVFNLLVDVFMIWAVYGGHFWLAILFFRGKF